MKVQLTIIFCLLLSGCAVPPIIPIMNRPRASGQDQSSSSTKSYNIKFGGRTTAAEGAHTLAVLLKYDKALEEAEAKREESLAKRYEALAEANKWKLWAMYALTGSGVLLLINFLTGGMLWRKAQEYRKAWKKEHYEHKENLRRGRFDDTAHE